MSQTAARQSPTNPFLPIEPREFSQMVADDPSGFLIYLRTLEFEHQRLTEAADNLTTRNLELKDIIDRAYNQSVAGSTQQKRVNQLAEGKLAQRVTQLEDENRNLRNQQDIHALIKTENQLLLAERQHNGDLVRNQSDIMEDDRLRVSYQLYGLGSHVVRLRSERDLLERNLHVTRRVSDIQNAVLKKEYEAQLIGLQTAYEELREDVMTLLPGAQVFKQMQNESHKIIRDIESWVSGCEFDTAADRMLFEHLADQFDAHLFQFQLRIFSLQDENRDLKDGLKVTQHAFSDLAFARTKNHHIISETLQLALKFRQMSAEALGTFNDLFGRATDVTQRNFEKLQITMRDKGSETEDDVVLSRIATFSERVRQFGEAPLSQMISDIAALVSETQNQFVAMQDKLDALAAEAEGSKVTTQIYTSDDEKRRHCWFKVSSDGSYHNPASLECMAQSDQETLVDPDTSDSDSSEIGPLLGSVVSSESEWVTSDSENSDEITSIGEARGGLVVTPEQMHIEAAEAELSWQDQAFPLPGRRAKPVMSNSESSAADKVAISGGRVKVLADEIFEVMERSVGMGLEREPGKCLKMRLKFERNAVC